MTSIRMKQTFFKLKANIAPVSLKFRAELTIWVPTHCRCLGATLRSSLYYIPSGLQHTIRNLYPRLTLSIRSRTHLSIMHYFHFFSQCYIFYFSSFPFLSANHGAPFLLKNPRWMRFLKSSVTAILGLNNNERKLVHTSTFTGFIYIVSWNRSCLQSPFL